MTPLIRADGEKELIGTDSLSRVGCLLLSDMCKHVNPERTKCKICKPCRKKRRKRPPFSKRNAEPEENPVDKPDGDTQCYAKRHSAASADAERKRNTYQRHYDVDKGIGYLAVQFNQI